MYSSLATGTPDGPVDGVVVQPGMDVENVVEGVAVEVGHINVDQRLWSGPAGMLTTGEVDSLTVNNMGFYILSNVLFGLLAAGLTTAAAIFAVQTFQYYLFIYAGLAVVWWIVILWQRMRTVLVIERSMRTLSLTTTYFGCLTSVTTVCLDDIIDVCVRPSLLPARAMRTSMCFHTRQGKKVYLRDFPVTGTNGKLEVEAWWRNYFIFLRMSVNPFPSY